MMHINDKKKERLLTWSGRGEAKSELKSVAIPAFTLKQLEKRNALIAEADEVMNDPTCPKKISKTKKKLEKMTKEFKL